MVQLLVKIVFSESMPKSVSTKLTGRQRENSLDVVCLLVFLPFRIELVDFTCNIALLQQVKALEWKHNESR